jgi:hypothetical protein
MNSESHLRGNNGSPSSLFARLRRGGYFKRYIEGQLTLVSELVDAGKLTKYEAEHIRALLAAEWGQSDLEENPFV